MGRKTPPFPNYPEWTTARFWGFIRSGLREKFNRYPPKYAALKRASSVIPVINNTGEQVLYKTGPRKGTPKFETIYKCATCEQQFKQKEVQVDHIVPAGQLKHWDDLKPFVQRLFCETTGLQVLCGPCHDIKTKQEKK